MNAGGRLVAYAAGVAVAFAGAFGIAAAVVPATAAESWQETDMNEYAGVAPAPEVPSEALPGLSSSSHGYVLAAVQAPEVPAVDGELRFEIRNQQGVPLTDYATAHEKQLHLIVVRSDGQEFRHVHPVLDVQTGVWSAPWNWAQAGTYRVYADFTPKGPPSQGITLTTTVHVAGEFRPVASAPSSHAVVDDFEVALEGELFPGRASELTLSVTRAGEPVTTLEPYLGAFGHLVALREGDLAYLHVHADGDAVKAGETSGPEITFMAEAPTAGRYLLYLDFQVDGDVHTAAFVVDSTDVDPGDVADDESHAH